ncbi:hypothetical protein NMY22_g10927 [Coprinellus aureogranulatus]|nr:hypothetical protein NMY22_g11262 [Coprinellus aureogranulatus]KAJ3524600.1 hypothetical protein NMY22_g10927 [Coprinellus aureogranulatus]
MQLKNSLLIAAVMTATMNSALAAEGDVLTAVKVFQTVVSEAPFLVDQTTTVTWTQSASIAASTTPTVIPDVIQTGTALAR